MARTRKKPIQARLSTYRVGFGDCFLLTFVYSASDCRHILIDFGTTKVPRGIKITPQQLQQQIADDITRECGGKLSAIVATHRHKDHISGFATNSKGNASGDTIAKLSPDLVVLPWTEDPDAEPDAGTPTTKLSPNSLRVRTLNQMHEFAGLVYQEAHNLLKSLGPRSSVARQLAFLGEDNLKNASAVRNLLKMGQAKRVEFVYYSRPTHLERILPGVKVKVLGPPTLQQSDAIRKQRARDEDEFWQLQAAASQRFFNSNGVPLNDTFQRRHSIPPYARWLVDRLNRIQIRETLQIVRILDSAMNNTSVILLFDAGGQKFLFPGDAQIENWSYALFEAPDAEQNKHLLSDVNVYKVGHHGSLNATPKSLWKCFKHKSRQSTRDRLHTVVSTRAGVHGESRRSSEVPRRTLVRELELHSEFFSTDQWPKKPRLVTPSSQSGSDKLKHWQVFDL